MPEQIWTAQAGGLGLELGRFGAVVDPHQPQSGLHKVRLDGRPLDEGQFLQIESPSLAPSVGESDVDFYTRLGDLVATYPEQPQRPLRAQVYWRSLQLAGALGAVELLTAVQTSLLDSNPLVTACSSVNASSAYRLIDRERGTYANLMPSSDRTRSGGLPHCYLMRLAAGPYSYVEMVHPDDVHGSRWEGWIMSGDLQLQLRHDLFTGRLEKGVILKARVLGLWLDRAGDEAAAVRHYQAFLAEELPLTT